MPLAGLRANIDFSQWSLSIEGIPRADDMSANRGMAMLFESPFARANGASSAATEMRKIIGGPFALSTQGKIDLSEKPDRGIGQTTPGRAKRSREMQTSQARNILSTRNKTTKSERLSLMLRHPAPEVAQL